MHTNTDKHSANHDILNGVRCEVSNCTFNEHKACSAKEIKVGPQFAASSSDTICATFKPEK